MIVTHQKEDLIARIEAISLIGGTLFIDDVLKLIAAHKVMLDHLGWIAIDHNHGDLDQGIARKALTRVSEILESQNGQV